MEQSRKNGELTFGSRALACSIPGSGVFYSWRGVSVRFAWSRYEVVLRSMQAARHKARAVSLPNFESREDLGSASACSAANQSG